jgi:hypothetical protein
LNGRDEHSLAQNGEDDTRSLEDAAVQLQEVEEERAEADSKLKEILTNLEIGL